VKGIECVGEKGRMRWWQALAYPISARHKSAVLEHSAVLDHDVKTMLLAYLLVVRSPHVQL
jgi:hypothetical protein